MLNIARLFGKSPFAPLQTHMKKVAHCVEKLSQMFAGLAKKDVEKIAKAAHEISRLEHEADLAKNDIRNHLPRSIFLPIDRSQFLDILSIQDDISDKAEDIATLLTLSPLEECNGFLSQMQNFFRKNEEVFIHAKRIIEEIDELLESSFGGIEAEKVKTMVEETAYLEHEASKMQHVLKKELFIKAHSLSNPGFYLWMSLIEEVAKISHLSESLANRIRMVLELK
ncbi:MAG: TIGR00153 family protein [Candidatus Rhabdochlamydia sp.]|jgi:predicted phosphate transport protein (TIGR00153 family)|nr:uncharacterized protein [Chlamydiota bacterium]